MSPLNTMQVKAAIARADEPSKVASFYGHRGGYDAHRILDWVTGRSPLDIWVKTARFGWHPATPREKRILFPQRIYMRGDRT